MIDGLRRARIFGFRRWGCCMRKLVAGAGARRCLLATLLQAAAGIGQASDWRALDERIAELEQTTASKAGRRLHG